MEPDDALPEFPHCPEHPPHPYRPDRSDVPACADLPAFADLPPFPPFPPFVPFPPLTDLSLEEPTGRAEVRIVRVPERHGGAAGAGPDRRPRDAGRAR
ncbi:hypothetical protein AB0J52_34815, partial [Spirillospora sp. NPDC049652]